MPGTGQIAYTLIADDADASAKLDAFVQKFEGTARRSEKATGGLTDIVDEFGKRLQTSILGGATAFAVIDHAIGKTRELLRNLQQERDNAASAFQGPEASLRALAQQSGGDPRKLRQLVGAAEQTALTAGVGLEKGAALQLELENAGMGEYRSTFAKLFDIGADPAAMVKAVGAVQDAMGRAETGDARAVLNKLLIAGKPIRATPEEIGKGVGGVAPFAAPIGASDEEVMASVAAASNALGSVELGSTAVSAFARFAAEQGLGKGKGIMAAVSEVQAMNLDAQGLAGYMGEARAQAGFRALMQRDFQTSLQAQIAAGQYAPEGTDQLSGDAAAANMVFGVEKARRVAEQKALRVQREHGESETMRQTAALAEEGRGYSDSILATFAGKAAAKAGRFFGAAPETVAGMYSAGSAVVEATGQAFGDYKELFLELAGALKENTDATRSNTAPAIASAGIPSAER